MSLSNEPHHPLRQRMVEDMQMRKFSPKTQAHYLRAVINFTRFFERSPEEADAEDLRRYQLHLVEQGISSVSMNATISGLRFLFETTLDKPKVMKRMFRIHQPRKIPEILSPEEVTRLLQGAVSLKFRAALAVAYGAGLRASEVVHLKPTDIDSQRMLIRVEEGKGGHDRQAMLSPALLTILRGWWRKGRAERTLLPGGWLFPGQTPVNPMSPRTLNRAFHNARKAAKIHKPVSLHSLRHAFATHLLEQHEDIRLIQVLLGHKKMDYLPCRTMSRYVDSLKLCNV